VSARALPRRRGATVVSGRALVLFALVAALWGVPFYFIKLALDGGTSAVVIAWVRVALAALVLMPVAFARGSLSSLRGRWHWVGAVAVLDVAAPFALVSLAERTISSSLSAILVATTPLFLALLALRFDSRERVHGRRLLGLIGGFGGVVVLLGADTGGAGALVGGGFVILASLGYAAATLIVKRELADVPPLAVTTAALTIASLLLLVPAALTRPARAPSSTALLALLALGLVCTAAAFLAYYALIGLAGAGRAALITYVSPVFALILGVSALGEPFTPRTAVGLTLILGGSWIAAGGRPPPTGPRAGVC
jgi:drug/metabolite transporter (DMT)-like permease